MRLMDDQFMTMVFAHSKESVQHTLRVILDNNELEVRDVRTQDDIPNLWGHAVRLDVHAIDATGLHYDVEIQRAEQGAPPKRARYNMALLDAELLAKGVDYNKLPEVYIIFIAEYDIYGQGKPLYHVDRTVRETGELFGDGGHIIYANGEYVGEDPMGLLMADFRTSDPAEMNSTILAQATNYYKNTKEGVETMCKIMEDIMAQGVTKGRAEGVIITLRHIGASTEQIVSELMKQLGMSKDEAIAAIAACPDK